MTRVTAQMSVSLDGFYAGPEPAEDEDLWTSHDDGTTMGVAEARGFFRVTRWITETMAWREIQGFDGGERNVSSEIIEETFAAAGAYVMGRRMFDAGEEPWGDTPPFGAPVFVVTSRPRETLVRKGGTSFTFVTDGIASAIAQARAAAGGKNVAVAGGGRMLQQVIAGGHLDEMELHIVPVLLGQGMRLLGAGDHQPFELVPTRVVDTPDVTHVRYRVDGPGELVFDDRGRSGGATVVAGQDGDDRSSAPTPATAATADRK